MAHNKVFGICESKCKVLVPTMEDFDQCYRDIETTAEDTKRLLKASANYAFEKAVTTIYGWSDYAREMAFAIADQTNSGDGPNVGGSVSGGSGTGGSVFTPLEDLIDVSEYLKYNYMASKYRIDIDNLKGVIKVQGQSKFDDSKISTRTTETISFFNGWYTLCPLHRELSKAGLKSDSYKIDNATITMNRVTPFGAAGVQKVFDNQVGNDYGGGFLTYKNNLLLGEKNIHLVGSMSIGLAGEIELRPWSLVQDFCHKVLNHDLINEDDTSIGTLAADDFDAFVSAVAGKTFFWEVELPIQKHCPTLI